MPEKSELEKNEAERNQDGITVKVPVRIDFAGGWSDVHYFAAREGGAVLNAAIDHYVTGRARWEEWQLHLEYELTLPADSHLGSSGAIDVAWLALTHGLMGQRKSGVELAEMAYRLEKLLGVEGGKQDQYAAALGGFNMLRFKDETDPVTVEQLDLPPETVRALEAQSVLCYSGTHSSSTGLHEQVWEKYRQGDEQVTAALREIRDSVFPAREALLAGDFRTLAQLLTTNREATRRLHPDTVTSRMDELFQVAEEAGAWGGKGCGAGGGGCLFMICAPGQKAAVEEALQAQGGQAFPFSFVPARD